MAALVLLSLGLFYAVEKLITVPRYYMYMPLDDKIPFLPVFVIPYAAWYLIAYGMALLLFLRDEEQFFRYALFLVLGMAISCTAYILWPNGQLLRPEVLGGGLCSRMIALLYSVDSPVNSAPSLHVIYAFASNSAILRYTRLSGCRRPAAALSWISTVLICISTVCVKQHSVADVFLGTAVAAALHWLIYVREPSGGLEAIPEQASVDPA